MSAGLQPGEVITRLQAEVYALEEAMDALYVQAAKQLLEQALATSQELDRLADALIRKKRLLALLQGQLRCPACQTIQHKSNRFCGFCGQALCRARPDGSRKEENI